MVRNDRGRAARHRPGSAADGGGAHTFAAGHHGRYDRGRAHRAGGRTGTAAAGGVHGAATAGGVRRAATARGVRRATTAAWAGAVAAADRAGAGFVVGVRDAVLTGGGERAGVAAGGVAGLRPGVGTAVPATALGRVRVGARVRGGTGGAGTEGLVLVKGTADTGRPAPPAGRLLCPPVVKPPTSSGAA
ncbi:hypothetical protein GCM10020358_39090 [Amorphoplanes nipponensis]|uniref:hypothetical protein n=1 Tax=Actinoplanes nipponensis TaxID=135950 RepID=UPI0031EACCA8